MINRLKMMQPATSLFILALVLVGVAANESQRVRASETNLVAQTSTPKVHQLRGQIVTSTIDGTAPEGQALVIDHEPMEEYMQPMRMTLQVGDPAEIENLRSGDKISFEMVQREEEFYIRNIQKLPPDTELNLSGVEVNIPIRPEEL